MKEFSLIYNPKLRETYNQPIKEWILANYHPVLARASRHRQYVNRLKTKQWPFRRSLTGPLKGGIV